MTKQVEFYFDFASAYSSLAYWQLPKVVAAHNAQIVWRPMLLGAVFKATGNRSPVEVPAKGNWSRMDLQRWAKHYGVTFKMTPYFPINSLMLMRGAVGLQMRGGDFKGYSDAMFRAIWQEERNMNSQEEVVAVLRASGFNPQELIEMANDQAVKDELRRITDQAVERGVFGAPTFFVGDEMYWGQDRLQFVGEALAR